MFEGQNETIKGEAMGELKVWWVRVGDLPLSMIIVDGDMYRFPYADRWLDIGPLEERGLEWVTDVTPGEPWSG